MFPGHIRKLDFGSEHPFEQVFTAEEMKSEQSNGEDPVDDGGFPEEEFLVAEE